MSSELVRDIDANKALIARIEKKYGPISAQEFAAMYASRALQVSEKIDELEAAIKTDMNEFVKLASWAITSSAQMASFRGNFEDLHVVATVAYNISKRWMQEQGKNDRCSKHSPYARAHRMAARENGHPGMAKTPKECYCTPEESNV